ncbi:MAG: glycosyltransferase [Parvibaculaceae bacterium]|nr:glycosyltransferase [Parvibaculaceae bacterium]
MSTGLNGVDSARKATNIPGSGAENRHMNAQARVLIAVPFYKNEHLVPRVVDSLVRCAEDIAAIGGEVLFYDDSPEYAPLAHALEEGCALASRHFPCRLITNPRNSGFVQTMNLAMGEAIERHCDIILLNSDTFVFPGAFAEMARVAALDPMTGFVNPRSNNATIASFPHQEKFRTMEPEQGFAAYRALARYLPEVSYVPTAIGFCLLIRHAIIAEFGVFDEIYGAGYNEENDLVMRANRCGYRAVLANKAYVWHEGEQSFASSGTPKALREEKNRAILLARYPEYKQLTENFHSSPSYRAEYLLGTLLPGDDGRLDVAFDFSSFGPYHNGTFKAGEQLLRAAASAWAGTFNLYVLCMKSTYEFHNYASCGAEWRDPKDTRKYAAIFRVGQPYEWGVLERMYEGAAVTGLYMLDTISIDCGPLFSPYVFNIWQFALENSDFVASLSNLTAGQIGRRFRSGPGQVEATIMLSLDVRDYALEKTANVVGDDVCRAVDAGCILVIGNSFPHKYVAATANQLGEAYPDRQIVAFGVTVPRKLEKGKPDGGRYAPADLSGAENILGIRAGDLSDSGVAALYEKAAAIVFPSHYEGFGIPLMNALAMRRPIFVRRLPVFEEIWRRLGQNPNFHFYETTRELAGLLTVPPVWVEYQNLPVDGGSMRVAGEIFEGLQKAISNVDYQRILRRLEAIELMDGVVMEHMVPGQPKLLAARVAGGYVERLFVKLFSLPLVYGGFLLTYRKMRQLYRLVRRRA